MQPAKKSLQDSWTRKAQQKLPKIAAGNGNAIGKLQFWARTSGPSASVGRSQIISLSNKWCDAAGKLLEADHRNWWINSTDTHSIEWCETCVEGHSLGATELSALRQSPPPSNIDVLLQSSLRGSSIRGIRGKTMPSDVFPQFVVSIFLTVE